MPDDKVRARRAIRAGRRARRDAQSAADRRADGEAIRDAIISVISPEAPVAAYESLATEPPTEALIAALREAGHEVLLPVLLPDKDLDWRSGDDETQTLGTDAIAGAGVIVVPALAIARDGLRLGQGGGSYDRALARRAPGALVVAVVYDDELADVVPSDPHDQAVDAVVTPAGGLARL
ncbi:hypothetical protein VV02_08410 [Luteipulveratus mongoliensis]|uniref:5-formyltetrahydrofolate cyclo-ligase n=1 Tax=Luteipulveratus mongoliensis TaxID=571913 RepID=A0A0K1JPW5_9MICO|nr:hypothetical protein VV02_08410 [Luteipulveratus mongoliensis]